MNALPAQCSVLIVGAGPSGLMMAAQLLRYGIQPVIIDAKRGLNEESRALAVQSRSLEIFRQLGLDTTALQEGNIVKGLKIHEDADEVAHLDLSSVAAGLSEYPYVLILEQNKTERILLDYLTAHTCPVYWDTELLDVFSTDKGASVKLRRGDSEVLLDCQWLVGADGASSKVRKSLGLPFSGGTYLNRFYLADLHLDQEFGTEQIRIFLKDEGFVGIFPMPGNNYRFIGVLPQTLKSREHLTFEDIKPYITYTLGVPLQGGQCNWFSIYQLHHRMSERFRSRHCFLIGDAAHIHSPVGGQGMNTGLQDAYNLAWKLSGVINNEYREQILDSYPAERMPVAKSLLKTTDRLFTIAITPNWVLRKLRNWLLPKVLRRIWQDESAPRAIFSRLSQLEIRYRSSKLSVHHSRTGKVKAGDRLPFLKVYDEKRKEETTLHSWCSKPGFTLLVIGQLGQRDVHLLAKWIKSSYPFQLNFFYLPPSKRNQQIFDFFEIAGDGKKMLLVRPDLHIGYMNDIVDIELIDIYLKETIGWRKW